MSIGILGLGTHLPAAIRTNDWWSPEIVASWHERAGHRATSADPAHAEPVGDGATKTLAVMAEYAADPFRGAILRRVMDESETVSQMEMMAAQEAIERAGIPRSEIDVILTQTPVPEHLMVNSACVTHRLLALPQRCLALGTEGACNGFALHVSLARALIESGRARYVLSVHSSAITRVHDRSEPQSAWWGDGAAAAVIGRVADGAGLLAAVDYANGSSCEALVLGVPGRRWWEPGAITTHAPDRGHTRAMLMSLADRAREAIRAALAASGVAPGDVDFYASHQGTAWFSRLTAAHAGIGHAERMTTFPDLGNMNSVNVPFILAKAERDGVIRDGSIVVTFSGGLGETWSSMVFRWGRR